MLGSINRNSPNALAAANRFFSDKPPTAGVTAAQASAVAVLQEESVTVSITPSAITASFTSSTVVATAGSGTDAASPALGFGGAPTPASAAEAEAQRGQSALAAMSQAKSAAAGAMKQFLRQKLDGYKKQLELLRLLGSDPLDIAKGTVRIARGVAGAARDYAAATLDEKAAGQSGSGSASGSASDTETVQQAEADAAALKAQAEAAPDGADPASGGPTNPDDQFFYEAFQILGKARKTLLEAQRVDVAQNGTAHAKDFKKLRQREGELEDAVTKSYVAMKTGGDLKAVDALLNDGGGGGPAVSALV